MPTLLATALAILLAAPDAAEKPDAAIERLVAAVHRGELKGAYGQLGDGVRATLAKDLKTLAPRVGLDPETATPEQILGAFEAQLAASGENGKTVLQAFSIEIGEVGQLGDDADRATMTATLVWGRRRAEVEIDLACVAGSWRIEQVETAPKEKRKASEAAAIATLRNLVAAQAHFQAVAVADVDRDGEGEYGTFAELSGATGVRGGKPLDPPVLAEAFRKVENGIFTRGGYHFRIYLCDGDGKAIGEEHGTGGVDAELAERVWCAYAWPTEPGGRAFFVNQLGDVLAGEAGKYHGERAPEPGAAFRPEEGRDAADIRGDAALNTMGRDGLRWSAAG